MEQYDWEQSNSKVSVQYEMTSCYQTESSSHLTIKKIMKHYREATPDLLHQELHQMFLSELSKIAGIGPMRCNQLFSSLCLTGLFPILAMTDCISFPLSTNPVKILKA